jgi:hypothetical protein
VRTNDYYQRRERRRYGLYGTYGSGGGVVEVTNKILGLEEIAGNRAVKSILPWPAAEQGKKPFTATSTVRRSENFGPDKTLSMSNHLSGVIMEGFVNCCQRSRGAPKDVPRKTERIGRGKAEEAKIIFIKVSSSLNM